MIHKPVLLNEIIKYLDPRPGQVFIDATINGGGHTKAIAGEVSPHGRVLGIELDIDIYNKAEDIFVNSKVVRVVNDSYINLIKIAEHEGFLRSDGILFDLGMSSFHVDSSKKGFSFNRDEPLDMRYSGEGSTAADILNVYSEENLAFIFKEYGGEKFANKIAKEIVSHRKEKPFESTVDLVHIIEKIVPRRYVGGKINPATKVFQAIRIETNREMDNIKMGLSQAIKIVGWGGRIAVISFHSTEDKIVKDQFRKWANGNMGEILTKKPIIPSDQEIIDNPRSRSAKLRVFKKK